MFRLALLAPLRFAACAGDAPVPPDNNDDELAGLDAMDGKADGASAWTLVGTGVAYQYVVAHSSGSYVAHELLEQLEAAGTNAALARISYADHDGGGTGLSDSIVAALGHIAFVYAHDPTLAAGLSHNSSTAIALAADYAPKATSFEVTVPATGCYSGASWCLHDVLITHRPHDPSTFDLALDYTDFAGRPITTEYLESLVPSLM